MSLKFSEISKIRSINQQLSGTSFKTGKEIVEWFGAVQGQEYVQSKWGLGLRLPHLKDDDIEKEFTEGKILRTHILRPTWHFVSADDIRWLLMLSSPRVNISNSFMYRKLELDSKIFKRCNDIIIKALQGKKQLTRNELNTEFKKNKIIAEGHRLSYIMMRSELDGIICSGARRDKQFTYALIDERIPPVKAKTKKDALAELTKRYFSSRGPATVKDFSTWSGLTLTDCRKGIEMVNNLICERIGDEDFFLHSNSDIFLKTKPDEKFYLLPLYDEFIIGYKERGAAFLLKKNIMPEHGLRFYNMILFHGQVIGTWTRTLDSKHIDLRYELFKPLPKKQSGFFKEAVRRFEEFTQLSVNLIYAGD